VAACRLVPDHKTIADFRNVVGYNVQVAVDTESHLIVAHEVTNVGSDRSQLANATQAAKAALHVDKLEAVADRGYFNDEEIVACERTGITVTLPKPMTSSAKSEGRFGKQDFVYLPMKMPIAALRVRNSIIALQSRNTARHFTGIGPMRASPARSRLSVRREESVASRDGSTRSKPIMAAVGA
jgi:hypothetical protein